MNSVLKYLRIPLLILLDCLLVTLAGGLGLLVRYELALRSIPADYVLLWLYSLPMQLLVTVVAFALCRMYPFVWHAASAHDVPEMLVSTLIGSVTSLFVRLLMGIRLPISAELISMLLQVMFLVGVRCAFRFFTVRRHAAVQDIQVEDLLGREPVQLNLESVRSFLGGKRVLITGGGGSIGSELCRQIVRHGPAQLVILDIYENNAYDLQQELLRSLPEGLDLRVEIASIRDRNRIESLFRTYRPQIVFHAAAHKHVPLMEDCPAEAIKNNIFGTYNMVRAAEQAGTEKFVMISTDKAVNPTNLMGATKRFCEMILQSRMGGETEFCAVRFGNVLESNGSVVPLFRRQIEAGGPVTITDKRIIRYFMTIQEASQLVLEAGSMAKHGQIFVLEMGDPVRILDLAENMIRLSGLKPYEDIQIKEIGLRPGEKLYEELLMSGENLSQTDNRKIFVEQQTSIPMEQIQNAIRELEAAVRENRSPEALIELVRSLVPTYRSPEEVNEAVDQRTPK